MTELTRKHIEQLQREAFTPGRTIMGIRQDWVLALCTLALEALNQREQGGWQPIETAPRDGKLFWACRPSLTEESGYWVALMKFWDGHFIDGNGKAYEPHFWKPNTEKPAPPAEETE